MNDQSTKPDWHQARKQAAHERGDHGDRPEFGCNLCKMEARAQVALCTLCRKEHSGRRSVCDECEDRFEIGVIL